MRVSAVTPLSRASPFRRITPSFPFKKNLVCSYDPLKRTKNSHLFKENLFDHIFHKVIGALHRMSKSCTQWWIKGQSGIGALPADHKLAWHYLDWLYRFRLSLILYWTKRHLDVEVKGQFTDLIMQQKDCRDSVQWFLQGCT